MKIQINRPVAPNTKVLNKYLKVIEKNGWYTNFGPLHEELTEKLQSYLGVDNLLLVSNGTLALHVAYRALDIKNAICTPFSFAATASSLAWEKIPMRFCDINKETLNIDPCNVEKALKNDGKIDSLVATHVYGNACEVKDFERISSQYNIKIIYDAAHAFGINFGDKSLLTYGDAATLSLHATKLFHTVEGGAIVFKDSSIFDKAKQLINFNLDSDGIPSGIGINAKLNEYQCAVGLTNLESIDEILTHRIMLYKLYTELLSQHVQLLKWDDNCSLNGSYMPIVFKNENEKLKVKRALDKSGIPSREYFSPSLNTIFKPKDSCPFSESVSSRILCLPIHFYLTVEEVKFISLTISESI